MEKGCFQEKNKLKAEEYERELRKLRTKLVEMQEWVRGTGAKIILVFEGRDAAGKGGVIHRIMERVSPVCSVMWLCRLPQSEKSHSCTRSVT